jgi:N-acetylglucosaminyldiphosphoundecaprenol N-acetyl-beta-D-mannosaminyltransferase
MEDDKMNAVRFRVLGSFINIITWDQVIGALIDWGQARRSSYVAICNVHVVATAYLNPSYERIINSADMATPDGAPVAWFLRRLGWAKQLRINGPDLMWKYCQMSNSVGEDEVPSIYLYGGKNETLQALIRVLAYNFPKLKVAGAYSPPFRPLTPEEDRKVVDDINASGAGVVWVSLGCPKQELWMSQHLGKVNAVMIGVGAAFDYHAGTLRRAPLWMQQSGLEWIYRFNSEPRRLWRRYLVTNTVFLVVGSWQLISNFVKRSVKSEATSSHVADRDASSK